MTGSFGLRPQDDREEAQNSASSLQLFLRRKAFIGKERWFAVARQSFGGYLLFLFFFFF